MRLRQTQIKKSTQVALGGLSTALCLFLMFLACLFPFTEFAFPAMAGVVLVAVMIENGVPTAVLVYVAVSLLSMIIVPTKEAAFLFAGFFGYYPIVKAKLEKIRLRAVEYCFKYLLFNGAVIACFALTIALFGPGEAFDSGPLGKWALPALLVLGNITFTIYDIAITRVTWLYLTWFRPRILRKVK